MEIQHLFILKVIHKLLANTRVTDKKFMMEMNRYQLNRFAPIMLIILFGSCQSRNNQMKRATKMPQRDTILIKSMEFIPQDLSARHGDTVVWINQGVVAHNITPNGRDTSISGDFDVGDTWSMVVDTGFGYYCNIHPTMKGKITVK